MIKYIRNKCGIRIAMICASCESCMAGDPIDLKGEFRKCKDGQAVKPTDYCPNWKCRQPYILAGTSLPGRVKTKDYINHVTQFRLNENNDGKATRLKSKDLVSPDYVRQLYIDANPGKSIYMKI